MSALRFVRLRIVPMIAVGTITAVEVPLAIAGTIPSSRIIAGTMITPEPPPSSPADVPANRPIITSSTAEPMVVSPRPIVSVAVTSRSAVRITSTTNR